VRRRALIPSPALVSTTFLALTAGLATLPLACGSGETSGSGASGTTSTTSATGGTGGSGATGGTGGQTLGCVLDGMKSDVEQCDDGNDIPGDGCEPDCSFTCVPGPKGDAKCDDTDPCNGEEACAADHTCASGAPLPDGSACGAAKICVSGVCQDDVCGDLFVSAGEQCDDGNTTAGDGCDADCTYSCTAADPSKCAPADVCAGAPTCDDATHTCSPLVPLADGTACATGFCLAGACKSPTCGDGVPDPGEDCDDGNAIDGDGCDTACVFSCATPAADCPVPPECQMATCTALHTCDVATDPAKEGSACGAMPGYTCKSGACSAPNATCGNGVLEVGEACDFGAANGPGTGCETNCQFSCTLVPDSCSDNNPCNGVEACVPNMVGGKAGQKCQSGVPAANCTACPGGLCGAGVCKASSCGDGCVDAGAGEQCEPPGGPTCDGSCHTVILPVCGNGVRESGEQCDDGGNINLDGCNATCRFEQDHRANWLKMQFATDMFCTANALGGAFTGSTVQSQVQMSLDAAIANGSITVLFKFMGLDDLTGTSDPSMIVGVMNGSPQTMGGMLTYDGTSDLDWWHTAAPLSIDANRDPVRSMPGSINAKLLTAGPGTIDMLLILGGSLATLKISKTNVIGTVGATSTPLTSNGQPPGHLGSEHLDPALVSFATIGQPNAVGAAKLCGNASAASLALVPIPAVLVGGGITACQQGYTAANSLLDVLIGGCTILFTQQIVPTQPDQVDPDSMPVGAGGPYVLSANPATKAVNACKDKNGVVVPLQACLEAAAYSMFFKFTTDRVIIK